MTSEEWKAALSAAMSSHNLIAVCVMGGFLVAFAAWAAELAGM